MNRLLYFAFLLSFIYCFVYFIGSGDQKDRTPKSHSRASGGKGYNKMGYRIWLHPA